jgi:hypothetical protein
MSVRSLFLPEGYPNSTSEDYLAFQLYDSVQGLSSYCRGVLVTQALMIGIGVGEEAATPLGAAFQCAHTPPLLVSVALSCLAW